MTRQENRGWPTCSSTCIDRGGRAGESSRPPRNSPGDTPKVPTAKPAIGTPSSRPSFPRTDLEAELKDAAARMGDLRIAADDLARERPRLLTEVDNMFGDFPMLGRLESCPRTHQADAWRRTTRRPALRTSIRLRSRNCKPTGPAITSPGTRSWPCPEPSIPPPRATDRSLRTSPSFPPARSCRLRESRGQPKRPGAITELKVRSPLPDAESTACLAYAAPLPGSDLYAPFLVLVSRLWAGAGKLGDDGPTGSPVYFTPLDDGAVIAISTTAKPGENAAGAIKRLESFVAETIEPKLEPSELTTARQQFSFLLGLVEPAR